MSVKRGGEVRAPSSFYSHFSLICGLFRLATYFLNRCPPPLFFSFSRREQVPAFSHQFCSHHLFSLSPFLSLSLSPTLSVFSSSCCVSLLRHILALTYLRRSCAMTAYARSQPQKTPKASQSQTGPGWLRSRVAQMTITFIIM